MNDPEINEMADRCIERGYVMERDMRRFVDYLFQKKREGIDGLHHAATGMAGEAGEVLDLTKKMWVYERILDGKTVDKLLEESGDCLHYLFMLMIKLSELTGEQIWLTDLMLNNFVKLRKRYPNGFSNEAALARADQRTGTTDGQGSVPGDLSGPARASRTGTGGL